MPEFWIIDPFAQDVGQYLLTDGKYVCEHPTEVIRYRGLNDVEIRIAEIW